MKPGVGIPIHCTVCGVKLLNPHEITGLCLEDKLIRRNERLASELSNDDGRVFLSPPEPVLWEGP